MTTRYWHPYLDAKDVTPEQADAYEPVGDGDPVRKANLEGSKNGDGTHSIVLDLDGPHEYRHSTTPGHAHLVIPASISWDTYAELLKALAGAGVITDAYLAHSLRRGETCVRAAGCWKPDGARSSDEPAGWFI